MRGDGTNINDVPCFGNMQYSDMGWVEFIVPDQQITRASYVYMKNLNQAVNSDGVTLGTLKNHTKMC